MARRRKPTQAEKLSRYKDHVERALRDMEPRFAEWRRFVDFYRGIQWDTQTGLMPDNGVIVNQVGPIVNTILPSIYTEPPRVRMKAMRPQNEHDAALAEHVVNYDWRRINIDYELRRCALDMLVIGIGWAHIGYEYEETISARDPNEVEADVQELLATVQELAAGIQPAVRGELVPGDAALPTPGAEGATGANMPQAGATEAPEFAGELMPPEGTPPILAALLEEEQGGMPAEDTIDTSKMDMREGLPEESQTQTPIDPSLLPDEATIRELVPATETVVIKDDIFAERVSPFDIIVDPQARSMVEARWVARRRVVPLDEVLGNPFYRNTKDLKGSPNPNLDEREQKPDNIPGTGVNRIDPHGDEFIVLWEYYDLRQASFCVFTMDSEKFLYEGEWEMPFVGGPFVRIANYEVPDSLWPYGEVHLILDLQVELNRTRTQIINHNRRFNRKILIDERALGDEGRAALESNIDGAVIPVINGIDLKNAVLPLPDSPLPPDRYQMSQIIEQDIQVVTGISNYERGVFNNVRRTATEAAIIQEASSLRQQDKVRRIEDAAAEIGRRMLRLAQTFYDRERWVLITGNGWQVPARFDLRDIQGEYDVSVEAGSTLPLNQEVRKQEAERLFMLLQQDPNVNHLELVKFLLKAHGLQNPERFLDPFGQMGMGMMAAMGGEMGGNPMGLGGMGVQGPPGMQPGQLGLPAPEEVGGGAQAAGVR